MPRHASGRTQERLHRIQVCHKAEVCLHRFLHPGDSAPALVAVTDSCMICIPASWSLSISSGMGYLTDDRSKQDAHFAQSQLHTRGLFFQTAARADGADTVPITQ